MEPSLAAVVELCLQQGAEVDEVGMPLARRLVGQCPGARGDAGRAQLLAGLAYLGLHDRLLSFAHDLPQPHNSWS